METGKVIIHICGIYSVGFAIFHMLFWRLFNWKKDLKNIPYANRGLISNSRVIFGNRRVDSVNKYVCCPMSRASSNFTINRFS